MRKRKAPIAAVFFLALLLAIIAFFNMRSDTPAGVYDMDKAQAEVEAARQEPPTDTTRRQEMQKQLQGPVPNAPPTAR